VSPRVRVYSTVVLAAVGAAAGVVAITAATSNHPPKPLAPRAGKPPLASDWTAPPALAASVQRAFAAWPRDTLSTLRSLAGEHPRSAFVHLNFGLALYWQRDDAGALAEWRKAKDVAPDTPSAVRAGDLLHPSTPPGLPQFQPTFARATTSVQLLLVRGIQLQRSGRPLSAQRLFARAARLAPNDVDARVAAAVGRYDKDHPERAFSQLGALTARFPDAQTVRFHLGLLSLWIGAFAEARRQLRLAVRDGPKTAFATEAKTLLARLGNVGTK
jgi:tetratricopeptide (TPR) repeat protein